MESYSDKKFSSVKPSIVNKQNVIKSEIVIQVNTPLRSEDVSDFSPPHPPPPPINVEVLPASAFVPPPPPLNFAPPPPPLNLAPLPPPMPHHANIPVKKWAPVETENPCVPPTKEKVHNSAATNLAAVLTQNALFKRKAHESETKTETVTDFATSDSPKPIKQNSVTETEKHIVKPFVNHRTITVEVPLASPPKSLNDVDYDTTTIVPIADKSAKVNTSDPNVKKMVYSTYRGLLGAYNNKANGMIATLPRSMVRKDRGITKQLESITLQGAIEKLNGRTNPKVEKD